MTHPLSLCLKVIDVCSCSVCHSEVGLFVVYYVYFSCLGAELAIMF